MQNLNCNQSKSGKVLFMYVLVKEKLLLKQEIKIGHFVSGLLIGIFKLFDLDYSKTEKSTNIINCMKKKNRFCCINAKKTLLRINENIIVSFDKDFRSGIKIKTKLKN